MARVFTIAEGLENLGALKTGGQGSVYKAKRVQEVVTAVKILPTPIHSETPDDKNFVAFENEVTKLKRVSEVPNPNIVKLLSYGFTESGNFPFIEMEFIEGPDLEELLKPPHDPIFTIRECVKVAEQLSCALEHCHKADVKHGDLKSNNIKFNSNTGNYVLLDFGLALLTDEERRTSLRHAGAVEFMAPEQSEGQMIPASDVYSFGVVLFELLCGTVPFPLGDKGETARNHVMLAHMETPVPDPLLLRQNAMPESWDDEKKKREMQVPQWLLTIIYKCLEKDPRKRFANGGELHQYITANSVQSTSLPSTNESSFYKNLQLENRRLKEEKERLQSQLQQGSLTAYQQPSFTENVKPARRKGLPAYVYLVLLAAITVFIFALVKKTGSQEKKSPLVAEKSPTPRRSIGQYKVVASRAYFHNEPDESTRRSAAYMVPSNDVVNALDEEKGFIYTEFTNNKGQVSKGWVRKQDLMPLEQWMNQTKAEKQVQKLTPEDINQQLADARKLLDDGQTAEALYVYNFLAEQDVPEALYQCGNLALKKKNDDLDCKKALAYVKKASDKGYAPAKRTLGFLYIFADNKEVLQLNDYELCEYDRNVFKGTKLLMEAVLNGDSTAQKILDELNLRKEEDSTTQ